MPSLKLNLNQKRTLLEIARKTIENTVLGKNPPQFKIEDKLLNTVCGAFVTIHKNGNLRGCIGNVIGSMPLYKTIVQMAAEACMHDPRFHPVTPGELADLDIEISVLSPFEKVTNIEEIKVGIHGILIRQGYYQGLLLPQVAAEYNWNRTQFLEHTCLKAGLGKNCYRDRDCEILIFSATVFGENEIA